MELYGSAMLFEIPNPAAPSLIQTHPSNFILPADHLIPLTSSLWPFPTNQVPSDSSFVFTFNVGKTQYHTLLFVYKMKVYEIIISTQEQLAYLFHLFLESVSVEMDQNSPSPIPIDRFLYVVSLIEAWPAKKKGKFSVAFPSENILIKSRHDFAFTYRNFNPEYFFDAKNIMKLWDTVFACYPICILCNSAVRGCQAIFAIFSMFHPLVYTDDYILWLRGSDPRYNEILKGSTKYKIVGTSLKQISQLPQFKCVITIPDSIENLLLGKASDILEEIESRLENIMLLINQEVDYLMKSDVYSEFLGNSFIRPHFKDMIKQNSKNNIPMYDHFQGFSTSQTYKDWRKALLNQVIEDNPEGLRQDILSFDPSIGFNNRNDEELHKIIDIIKSFKSIFDSDTHVMAVLQAHESKIKKILNPHHKSH